MDIYAKHGRVYATQEDGERLTRQIWVFARPAGDRGLDTRVMLRAYFTHTRPTRRHKYRGTDAGSWTWDTPPHERHGRLPLAAVPLPDWLREAVLVFVRGLVALEPIGHARH